MMLIALLIVPIIAWGYVSGDFSSLLAQSGVNSEHYMSLMYNGDHAITPIEIISNLAWGRWILRNATYPHPFHGNQE